MATAFPTICPPSLKTKANAANDAAKQSVDKGIDLWKKIVAEAPKAYAPRRALADLYKKAERWNAFIEVLKEAVEKTTWAAPEDKIPILEEMIEVYRDRLKLDVMVVNAFNQILSIQPDNFDAADALAAQYETMKRWPDLIALLRKKAAVVESAEDKIALHARVANLFLEKFSNQAEAIKAYESILELDPDNSEALGFVKQMYEKRRDWEKLIAVNQREIDKLTDAGERKNRRIEVAKLASEKMKKASVSIELWQKVLADDADNMEALGELEKLYEREKAWSELGAVLERQVAASDDADAEVRDLREAGHPVHREGAQRDAGDRGLAGAAGAGAGEPPRAGRAEEALSPVEGLGRAGGVLRRRRTSGTSWCACSNARRRPRTTAGASACGTRSASSIAIA